MLPHHASSSSSSFAYSHPYSNSSSSSVSPTDSLSQTHPFIGLLPGDPPVPAWSKDRVARWLEDNQLGRYQQFFLDADITGGDLLDLTYDQMYPLGLTTVQERAKMLVAIRRLKDLANPPSAGAGGGSSPYASRKASVSSVNSTGGTVGGDHSDEDGSKHQLDGSRNGTGGHRHAHSEGYEGSGRSMSQENSEGSSSGRVAQRIGGTLQRLAYGSAFSSSSHRLESLESRANAVDPRAISTLPRNAWKSPPPAGLPDRYDSLLDSESDGESGVDYTDAFQDGALPVPGSSAKTSPVVSKHAHRHPPLPLSKPAPIIGPRSSSMSLSAEDLRPSVPSSSSTIPRQSSSQSLLDRNKQPSQSTLERKPSTKRRPLLKPPSLAIQTNVAPSSSTTVPPHKNAISPPSDKLSPRSYSISSPTGESPKSTNASVASIDIFQFVAPRSPIKSARGSPTNGTPGSGSGLSAGTRNVGGPAPVTPKKDNIMEYESIRMRCIRVIGINDQSHIIDVADLNDAESIREKILNKFNIRPDDDRKKYALYGLDVSGQLDTVHSLDDETLLAVCKSPNSHLKAHLVLKKEESKFQKIIDAGRKSLEGLRKSESNKSEDVIPPPPPPPPPPPQPTPRSAPSPASSTTDLTTKAPAAKAPAEVPSTNSRTDLSSDNDISAARTREENPMLRKQRSQRKIENFFGVNPANTSATPSTSSASTSNTTAAKPSLPSQPPRLPSLQLQSTRTGSYDVPGAILIRPRRRRRMVPVAGDASDESGLLPLDGSGDTLDSTPTLRRPSSFPRASNKLEHFFGERPPSELIAENLESFFPELEGAVDADAGASSGAGGAGGDALRHRSIRNIVRHTMMVKRNSRNGTSKTSFGRRMSRRQGGGDGSSSDVASETGTAVLVRPTLDRAATTDGRYPMPAITETETDHDEPDRASIAEEWKDRIATIDEDASVVIGWDADWVPVPVPVGGGSDGEAEIGERRRTSVRRATRKSGDRKRDSGERVWSKDSVTAAVGADEPGRKGLRRSATRETREWDEVRRSPSFAGEDAGLVGRVGRRVSSMKSLRESSIRRPASSLFREVEWSDGDSSDTTEGVGRLRGRRSVMLRRPRSDNDLLGLIEMSTENWTSDVLKSLDAVALRDERRRSKAMSVLSGVGVGRKLSRSSQFGREIGRSLSRSSTRVSRETMSGRSLSRSSGRLSGETTAEVEVVVEEEVVEEEEEFVEEFSAESLAASASKSSILDQA
ncbi:hypothetical protein HK104_003042, partial [Borealophlyctis nickersoniae]